MSSFRLGVGRILRARFVDRPNRFLVRCRLRGKGIVEAFLPNPGRLWELLFPDVTLYLARSRGGERRTAYTVLAVERDGVPVFLHTHVTNQVARHLIETDRIPGLEGAEVIRGEVPHGNSRFDFLLNHRGQEVYAEVKSVTLFGNGVAMFPDAVTERGRKHLLHLVTVSRETETRSLVLFLCHSDRVRWFLPDYHTDLAFSQALLDVREAVDILPIAIGWTPDLALKPTVRVLEIPWGHIEREARDRGSYLLLLELRRARRLDIGRLGRLRFEAGWYVYVGSAMQGLTARLARHLRRRKRFHWHIDYLRDAADTVVPLPIRSSRREECDLAAAIGDLLERGPVGFGCSDCGCATHLFGGADDPLASPAFHALLQRYRMRPP